GVTPRTATLRDAEFDVAPRWGTPDSASFCVFWVAASCLLGRSGLVPHCPWPDALGRRSGHASDPVRIGELRAGQFLGARQLLGAQTAVGGGIPRAEVVLHLRDDVLASHAALAAHGVHAPDGAG